LADWSSLTKQVKDASDIVAVVGSYLTLRPAGRVFKAVCPFHNDSRPSLQVDPNFQNFRCWSCGKFGSVFDFVMGMEKVEFREALELLARRAGIPMPTDSREGSRRAVLLDTVKWAAQQYHDCLLESSTADEARRYLGERHLTGETVRKWQIGFAPASGDWLARQAKSANISIALLVEAGLLGERTERPGHYDKFRERVMFPIRDVRGQVVGFGGRILPSSPYASRVGKYINSSDTPLFSKSDLMYGLDNARLAGQNEGCLAVVEGYTDVLMAHQMGVTNVVATMGTALTPKHVRQLRRYAPRVVLVFDADEGGSTGVDRALELFVREDVDLAVARLPAGLDPCDLLLAQGPAPFQSALSEAADALDFKLDQILRQSTDGIESGRRAVEAVLGVLALVPDQAGPAAAVKRDLVLNRIAQRFGLTIETLRARLDEVRRSAQDRSNTASRERERTELVSSGGSSPADPLERELLEVLLADPMLVAAAKNQVPSSDLAHPGLRRLLDGLYSLYDEGTTPDLDMLRLQLADNSRLADFALRAQEVGLTHADRAGWLRQILGRFQERRSTRRAVELQGKLNATTDDEKAFALLKQLQEHAAVSGPPL
jgi:DNA primase